MIVRAMVSMNSNGAVQPVTGASASGNSAHYDTIATIAREGVDM